jgi:fluoroacetyl-CoA thioesterase
MKPEFTPGITREVQVEVTEDMCPAFDGIVVHRVYSTWSMVHHMELACRLVLVDFLDDDEEAVGAHVSVDHKNPAPVGTRVTVRAELVEVDGRTVTCRVSAWNGDRLLGEGKQVQVVMNKKKLKQWLERRP